MQSLSQFFNKLHDVDFPYVVLRNFENLPESVFTKGHGDLDLLVYDFKHFQELFPEIIPVTTYPRVRHKATIENLNIYMDIRYVGDGYYPDHFQRSMLNDREYNPKGFFTPDPVTFRVALAYHAVHHKNANTYKRYLGDVEIKELFEALKNSGIGYTTAKDPTVGRFNQYWKGATSVVHEGAQGVVKQQTGWGSYDLLSNEKRVLERLSSRHFPKVINGKKASLEIENCGDRLTLENLPADWKDQLRQILEDLNKFHVKHRDIKPDNLMVKNDVIKLIDFGWARFEDDPPDDPPGCLGYPYKPSWGFCDQFSMKKVMKEFYFHVEEYGQNMVEVS